MHLGRRRMVSSAPDDRLSARSTKRHECHRPGDDRPRRGAQPRALPGERARHGSTRWSSSTPARATRRREIARRLGARVGSFAWCDDFAAARNAALALTEAPWRLVLDADEWIVDGRRLARARCATLAPDVHRPDQRRQRCSTTPTAASATRRAGCRACCRAACATRPRPRAAGIDAAAAAPDARRRARRLSRRAQGEARRAATRSC